MLFLFGILKSKLYFSTFCMMPAINEVVIWNIQDMFQSATIARFTVKIMLLAEM
jgi:hypothetical protein